MTPSILLTFKKLHPQAAIPRYQTNFAAGFDFHAVVDEALSFNQQIKKDAKGDVYLDIYPSQKGIVTTGLSVAIPLGYEIQIRPRSGLAFRNSIIIHFGTVDEDFKGEIKIALFNLGNSPFRIYHGDRIAQGVIKRVQRAGIIEVEEFLKKI